MNFDNIGESRMEALRVFFYSALQAGCPYVNDFDNKFITIDDVIDFTIYEGIKKSYDYYAPKMKISEYLKQDTSLVDSVEADTKFYSRQLQYAQYYRSELNDMIEDERGIRMSELEGRDTSDIKVRTEGIECAGGDGAAKRAWRIGKQEPQYLLLYREDKMPLLRRQLYAQQAHGQRLDGILELRKQKEKEGRRWLSGRWDD